MKDNKKTLSIISVLLDLEGTCDYINKELIELFINELEFLKQKFKAEKIVISISTHHNSSDKIKPVLDQIHNVISKNENIIIGDNFYYGGVYSYYKDKMYPKKEDFNTNKLDTFEKYYLNNSKYDVKFFAVIDDMIDPYIYKRYKETVPMLLCRPSQLAINRTENNIMSISTTNPGFYGIVECLNKYENAVRHMSPGKLLEKQKKIRSSISQYEVVAKLIENDYKFIEENFDNLKFSESEYLNMLQFIIIINKDKKLKKIDKEHINTIFELVENTINKEEKEEENSTTKEIKKIKRMIEGKI